MSGKKIDGTPTNGRPRADGKTDPVGRVVPVVVLTVFLSVTLLAFAFSFGNVGHLGVSLGTPSRIAYLTGPAVDLSVAGLIIGGAYLAYKGIEHLWPVHVMSALCGVAMLALNCEQPVMVGHWRQATFDAVAPLLLIGWMMVGPWMLRHLATVRNPTVRTAERPTVKNQADTDRKTERQNPPPAIERQNPNDTNTVTNNDTTQRQERRQEEPPEQRQETPDGERQNQDPTDRTPSSGVNVGAELWAEICHPLYVEIRNTKAAAGIEPKRQRPTEVEFHAAINTRVNELVGEGKLPEAARDQSVSNAKRIRADLERRFPDLKTVIEEAGR